MAEATEAPGFSTWFGLDEAPEPTAVALILHGLNLKPIRMTSIADMLVSQGVECLNVSLRGHRDDNSSGSDPEATRRLRREAFKSVTRQIWLDEAREAYTQARERADAKGVPLVLVGFSLGAAIGTDLAIAGAPQVAFDGMIHFAPAFSIRRHTRLLRFLAPLRRLSLYSLSPRSYAANRSTPIAAYNALFESVAAVTRGRARQLEVAALIFIDPKDELVSYRGLRAICAAREAQTWEIVPVRKKLQRYWDYHHLIIDHASVGPELWSDIVCRVEHFLEGLRPGAG